MSYNPSESEILPLDEELMARTQTGDQEAFALLVHRYEKPLFSFLRRMTGNAADAEDVFQDTFLRVHSHRDQYRNGAPFRPWLYRIAANLSVDRLRRRKRRWWFSLDAPSGGHPEGLSLADSLAARGADADTGARAQETALALERALAALPAKHRAVFLMARYEDMSYEDIAQALQIPLGTVKSRMNTAVQRLRDAMKEFS